MKFNIIIRSILNYKNISEISAASGVVLDSSAKKEFNENFIKAKCEDYIPELEKFIVTFNGFRYLSGRLRIQFEVFETEIQCEERR